MRTFLRFFTQNAMHLLLDYFPEFTILLANSLADDYTFSQSLGWCLTSSCCSRDACGFLSVDSA